MTQSNKASPGGLIAACISAACMISVPLSQRFEGLRTHPYKDVTGLDTVCYGETQLAMQVYTPAECAVMLQGRQAKDYAPAVLTCVPLLAQDQRRNIFAASIDFAYNAGSRLFCHSSMARAFNAGRWADGCQAFLNYRSAHVNGRLVVVRGLANRRAAERSLCLKGLS